LDADREGAFFDQREQLEDELFDKQNIAFVGQSGKFLLVIVVY
jgi:hypothetical protein